VENNEPLTRREGNVFFDSVDADRSAHMDPIVAGIVKSYAEKLQNANDDDIPDSSTAFTANTNVENNEPLTRRECNAFFDSVDADGSGYIDKSELQQAMANMNVLLKPAEVDIIMSVSSTKLQSKSDEVLMSREEFVQMLLEQMLLQNRDKQSQAASLFRVFSIDEKAFYFPQRLLIAFAISLVTNFTLFITTWALMQGLYESILGMGTNAIRTIYVGSHKLESLYYETNGAELFDDELSDFMESARILQEEFQAIAYEVWIAMVLGCLVSFLAYLLSFWQILRSFRQKALLLRRGNKSKEFTLDMQKHKIADASNYVGIQISNGIVTYFLVYILSTLMVLPFTLTIIRNLIFSWKMVQILLPIVISSIVNVGLKKTFGYRLATNAKPYDHVRMRRLYHLYDLVTIFLKIAAGFMTAFVRFIITIVIALFTLPRIDVSPLPAWIERYLELDAGSKSFHAVLKSYHTFNHPLHITACWALIEHSKQRKIVDKKVKSQLETNNLDTHSKSSRTKTRSRYFAPSSKWRGKKPGTGYARWHLALMLHNYPYLRHFRSHALKAAAERQRQQLKRTQLLRQFSFRDERQKKVMYEI
jgi:Ca2+-binding EF-hand superfamily protein